MELVLSPGRVGGGDNKTGSPFQNEEVREWSHVDRLTGMLEHARIETGRWQTRHQGTAQAYGKVIDSRERNSADGNVVQKARRQVEVFQSQGIGGRSVQVVRASQWSSSRITDSTSSSPVSVSMNDAAAQLRNGNDDDCSLTKLSQVSRLCRQINGESVVTGVQNKRPSFTNLQSKIVSRSPVVGNRLKKFEGEINGGIGSSLTLNNNMKSTSNEDLTKSIDSNIKSQAIFTRDCKARRSLQIQKSVVSDFEYRNNSEEESSEFHDRNEPTIGKNDEKKIVKSYVLGMEENDDSDSLNSPLNLPKKIIDKKFIFNGTGLEENGKDLTKCEYFRPTPILLKPKTVQTMSSVTKSNTTVVHLNNKLFLDSQNSEEKPEHESISVLDNPINNTTTPIQSRVQSLANRFSNGHNLNSLNPKIESILNQRLSHDNPGTQNEILNSFSRNISSSSSRIEGLINRSGVINGVVAQNSVEIIGSGDKKLPLQDEGLSNKPTKKVGFCKTEVHFAAESGKVNIVETDCKPPPSNRFRRRRRNSIVTNMPIAVRNKNLPLIHFGDTSYEKYIFGQSASSNGSAFKNDHFNDPTPKEDKLSDQTPLAIAETDLQEKLDNRRSSASEELILNNGWGARLKTILQSEPIPIVIKDENIEVNSTKNFHQIDETIVDHSFKGSLHTTTVNLGANVITKLQKHTNNEGKCNTISTGIQLQFNTRPKKLAPAGVTSTCDITPCSIDVAKNNTAHKNPAPCSIVVSTVSKIPRPLIHAQQSVLKSAHLVMNLNRINSLNSMVKIAENGNTFKNNFEKNEDPLTLKNLLSSLHDNYTGMVKSRENSDVDIVNNNFNPKKTSTLITINANSSSTNYKNRITNGNSYSTRFTPLRLKHLNDRLNQFEERKDTNDVKENQLQYSSGSEQADEEVRSYMLGAKTHRTNTRHVKITHTRSAVTTEQCNTNVRKSKEEHSAPNPMNQTRDNDDFIDNIDQTHMIDDELDIVNSGLPAVDEMCFEGNKRVEKNLSKDEITNENKVVTSDNENNKVLMNIVTTHEPVIARVEDRSSPIVRRELFGSKKLHSNSEKHIDKILRETYSSSLKKTSVKHKAKDHCDSRAAKDAKCGSNDDPATAADPTYVNVFEEVKKSVPIYENCRVTRRNNINDKKYQKSVARSLAELNSITEATLESTNVNCDTETSLSNTDCEEDNIKQYSKSRESDAKLATISENNTSKRNNRESHKVKPGKTRSKKIVRPASSTSSIESIHRNSANENSKDDSEARPLHTKSTRSSRLRRVTSHETPAKKTTDRYSSNENKKTTTERTSSNKLTRSNRVADTSIAVTKNDQGTKTPNDVTRPKPIEIVYETAVFNMKNEKLAKSSRSKDSKTPRYINDIICGIKPKRSTDVRQAKGGAGGGAPSQRLHRKSVSPTNRHWK